MTDDLKFTLTDEWFDSWWAATILPEDSADYVHLHQGTIDGARFMCAFDYLVQQQNGKWTTDLIVKAYCIAMNRPFDMTDATLRISAQYMYDSDQVAFLVDCVRNRNQRIAETRIANLATRKIEELFERTKSLEDKELLDTERLALEMSLKFMGNQSRERGAESERRNKRALQEAITRNREKDGDMKRVPSLQELRPLLGMLIDAHGPAAIEELLTSVAPKAIDANATRN